MRCIMIVSQQGRYTLMPLKINGSNSNLGHTSTTNSSSATKVLICRRLAHVILALFIVGVLILPLLYNAFHQNPSIRHYPLTDWGVNISRNISHYILPDNDTTLIEPRNICEQKLFLLIIVCSGLQNFVARQTIRETWANITEFNYGMFRKLHQHLNDLYIDVNKTRLEYYGSYLHTTIDDTNNTVVPDHIPIRILFLVGRSRYETFIGNETILRIQQESEQYDDIVQEDFIDTYNNLTIKSVFALKWMIRQGCHKKAAFFMKCDDDTFINLPNLVHYLLGGTIPIYYETLKLYGILPFRAVRNNFRLTAKKNYLVGYLFCSAKPVSNISSKWYMPSYMYPGGKYPNYLSGSGYLMTTDVITQLYRAALETSIIYLEDVYVTGLCAERARIARVHNPLFNYSRSTKLCSLKGMITQHEMKDDSMYAAYNFVMNTTIRCPIPFGLIGHIRP